MARERNDDLCRLYRWVLARAVLDLCRADCLAKRTETNIERILIKRFFSCKNIDFLKVCEYADVEPKTVLKAVKKYIYENEFLPNI